MSLIKCPECNRDVSDSAKKCPNCGYKIKKIDITAIFLYILTAMVVSFLIFLFWNMSKKENYNNYSEDVVFCANRIVSSIDDYLDGSINDDEFKKSLEETQGKLNKMNDLGASTLALDITTIELKMLTGDGFISELKELKEEIQEYCE